MEFKLNKKDEAKLIKLFDTQDENIAIADVLLYAMKHDIKFLDGIKDENIFSQFLINLDPNDEYEQLIKRYFPNGFKKLDIDHYLKDEYFNNIKLKNSYSSEYKLKYESYKAKELFIYDDIDVLENEYFKEISKIGYFEKPYRYITLKKNDVGWMSIIPSEIDTMIDDINNAKGNIIVFGLGLGYYQYMCSLKDEVTSITIIEYDKTIIDFFNKEILPQFKYKDKIKIIYDNAYNHLNNLNSYDYVYIDLWHNPQDGLKFYLDFKKEEIKEKNKGIPFKYWLEKGILALFRRCFVDVLIYNYTRQKIDFKINSINDELIYKIDKLYKNTTFNTYEEIKQLLKDENLKKLATTI